MGRGRTYTLGGALAPTEPRANFAPPFRQRLFTEGAQRTLETQKPWRAYKHLGQSISGLLDESSTEGNQPSHRYLTASNAEVHVTRVQGAGAS